MLYLYSLRYDNVKEKKARNAYYMHFLFSLTKALTPAFC